MTESTGERKRRQTAERVRRHYRLKKAGYEVFQIVVHRQRLLSRMVSSGYIACDNTEPDKVTLQYALEDSLDEWLES